MPELTHRTWAKIALVLVGAVVFGYGVRVDHPGLRWTGIAILAAALLLRWWPGRRPPA